MPHSASASLRLRSGNQFSHRGHGGSAAAPPTPPSRIEPQALWAWDPRHSWDGRSPEPPQPELRVGRRTVESPTAKNMRTRVDPRLRLEASHFAFRFACEDCAHFDPSLARCSLAYVPAPRRGALEGRYLELCKTFELC